MKYRIEVDGETTERRSVVSLFVDEKLITTFVLTTETAATIDFPTLFKLIPMIYERKRFRRGRT